MCYRRPDGHCLGLFCIYIILKKKNTSPLQVADLKAQWEKKATRILTVFVKTPKRNRGESYFERYYRNGLSPWFREIKMNRRAFMSANRMRAGHINLKASLNRFSIVSTAERECGDGLQAEEHT
jgi:hypothetical protein